MGGEADLELGVEFFELGGLFVEFVEIGFGGGVFEAGVDVVSEDTNENEWADEGGVEEVPEDDATDDGADDGESVDVGEEGGGFGADDFDDFVAEAGEEVGEVHEDEIEDAGENATDNQQGEESHAKDAAEVLGESFAVLKEEDGTLESGFGGFFVFAVEDPAETTVTEVGDDCLNNARDGGANGATGIATNSTTNGGDGLADLLEDTLDDAGDSKIGGDGSEALFDNLLPFGDDVVGELVIDDGFGHHGDLAGFIAIRNIARDEIHDDTAEDEADD